MLWMRVKEYWDLDGVISAGDGKFPVRMPYAGEFVTVGGSIKTLGTGAGTSTDIQLRNETASPDEDILSIVGAFEVDSGSNLLEGQVVDSTKASFDKDDVIQLDVDAISTAPGDARIWAIVNYFMDDP